MKKIIVCSALALASMSVFGVLPTTDSPELRLIGTIRTNPFSGTSINARDPEGSEYISPTELWLVTDSGPDLRAFQLSTSGTLMRSLSRTTFANARKFGGGSKAGSHRTGDFEGMASAQNMLYIFSGACCAASEKPVVFRMDRTGGNISYQELPTASNFPAASARGDVIYVGWEKTIRTYSFGSGALGPILNVSGLSGRIQGMDFTPNDDLLIVTSTERLFRVNPVNRTVIDGWNLDLLPFGILDSRAVVVVPNSPYDLLFVSDGSSNRPDGDPLKYGVFKFEVLP